MTRRSHSRRLFAAGACAAITVGALAGTATAATGTHTVERAGSTAPLTLADALASHKDAVKGVEVIGQVVTPDASYYVMRIESWDGYCLTIPTAAVGTLVDQTTCGQDHLWWLDESTSDLYPEGHADAQVGDSGGYLELKSPGTGTPVYDDGSETGPGNETYQQLWFGVAGTFWHANGNGEVVTFDGEAGDHANYWWPDQDV
jgi:hypothetical protein